MARLWKLLRLPLAEQWLFVQALLLLPVNALALRLLSFNCWRGVLSKRAAHEEHSTLGSDIQNSATIVAQARRIARVVNWAARYGFFAANCLQRSLTLWWLLRRAGINSELKIGARLNGRQCEAHAWVECLGAVLNDSADVASQFPPFSSSLIPTAAKIQ